METKEIHQRLIILPAKNGGLKYRMRALTKEERDQRIEARVRKEEGGCWIWLGARRGYPGNQYGVTRIDGKIMAMHRYFYEKKNGEIAPGLLARHTCDNGLCCNPDHIIPGTHHDNLYDCIRRRRFVSRVRAGDDCIFSKISAKIALQIADLLRKGDTQKSIAESVGVTIGIVQNISVGKAWTHITGFKKFYRKEMPASTAILQADLIHES